MFPGTLDLFASIDQNVPLFITEYGFWTYLILFAIVVCETGLVITSFLPGDSLLFVSGLSAASGLLSLPVLFAIFWVAGITGSIMKYWIGRHVGSPRTSKRSLRRKGSPPVMLKLGDNVTP